MVCALPPISAQPRTLAALVAMAALVSIGAPADAADPHQHGVGRLNVAVQGDEVEIELETPGADIVGFEHEPRTAEQKRAVQDAATALRDGAALFVFPAAAGCTLKEAEVEAGLLGDDHKEHGHEKHGDKHEHEKHGDKHGHEKHGDKHEHEKHGHKEHGHKYAEKHHGDKHDEETHAEFHAHYHFTCKNPVTHADLRYFETFPRAEALSARTLTATGQRKQKLTRKDARLKF